MTSDLGPGDCVEANMDMFVHHPFTATGVDYDIAKGTRTIVVAISPPTVAPCQTCKESGLHGLLLLDYPLMPFVAWCPCEWRKVGGSKEEHLKQFAEYTRKRDAADIEKLVESLP